jgi:FkbM family methyltransferase
VAFSNLRGVLRLAADASSRARLVMAAAYSSRPRVRRLVGPMLWAMSRDSFLPFRFHHHGRVLAGSVRLHDLQSDLLGFYEIVMHDCYRIPRWLTPARVIDCGANLGFFTLSALARWPDVTVIAVEPLPENVAIIERHLAQNEMRAQVVRAALSAQEGTARFHLRDPNRGSIRQEDGPSLGTVDVQTMRLSALHRADASPCLVKLDIEGAELEVLEEFLRVPRSDCVFVGELHRWPETRAHFDALLTRAGFRVEYYAEDEVCVLFTAVPTATG